MPDRLVRSKSDEVAIDGGCYFDVASADRVRYFFERFLRHSKGPFAGRKFELLPWQWDRIVEPAFGWRMPDGTRRFRRVGVGVPKKNGKSTLLAGIGLYLVIGDGEAGAEVYSAAADKKQSSIIFNEAANMVRASPALYRRVRLKDASKRMEYGSCSYDALSAEVKTKEGYNIHGLLFDELHAQSTPDLWNALRFGGAARRQPMIFWISTAGVDRESICFLQWKIAKDVQESRAIDVGLLPVIYEAGDDDDPWSEETWKRVNPSYGETISKRDMEEAAQEAHDNPSLENNFRRYRLNQWTRQESKWVASEPWRKCQVQKTEVRGLETWGGLDLATTTDLNAFAALSRGERWKAKVWFWAPESALRTRERQNRQRIDHWAREGRITLTPGDVVDYRQIRRDVRRLDRTYHFREIGVDPWNATSLATSLADDGFNVEYVRMGFHTMSPAVKELEKLILDGGIEVESCPVLDWMFSNMAVKRDPAGNVKPAKDRAADKIDGIVSLLIALAMAMREPSKRKCVYEDRGLTRV